MIGRKVMEYLSRNQSAVPRTVQGPMHKDRANYLPPSVSYWPKKEAMFSSRKAPFGGCVVCGLWGVVCGAGVLASGRKRTCPNAVLTAGTSSTPA